MSLAACTLPTIKATANGTQRAVNSRDLAAVFITSFLALNLAPKLRPMLISFFNILALKQMR